MELIDKIKALFVAETTVAETPTDVETTFKDVKTDEGRILRIDGDKVTEITENGEIVLEDGTYTLEDGSSIVVVAGLITEDVETPAEDAPVDAPAEEMVEHMPAGDEAVAEAEPTEEEESVEEEGSDLEARVIALEEAIKLLVEKMGTTNEEMEAVVAENEILKAENETLSKVPAVEPIKTAKFEKIIGSSTKNINTNSELVDKISALRENK